MRCNIDGYSAGFNPGARMARNTPRPPGWNSPNRNQTSKLRIILIIIVSIMHFRGAATDDLAHRWPAAAGKTARLGDAGLGRRRERICVDEVLRGSFSRAGAPDALAVLDNMMAVIAGGAARTIDIFCVCDGQVSGDERRLLDVIALFQAGDTLETPLLLRSFLTPAAAAVTARLVERLATILSDAGLRLPARRPPTRRGALGAGPTGAGWADAMTLH